MTRIWQACSVIIALAAATNIANWVFHASILVFVLFGLELITLAVWVRLMLRYRKRGYR